MSIFRPQFSVAYQYFWIAFVIGSTAVLVALWLTLSSYTLVLESTERSVQGSTRRTHETFGESLSYIANFMRYMGEKIIRLDKVTPEGIATILQNKVVRSERFNDNDVFSWTFYDFVNPEGYVVASSTQGVLYHQPKVLPEQRLWMEAGPKNPWVLHPSYPDIGIISGEHILPVGLGVTTEKGEFLGIITIGLNIDKLKRRLEKNNDSDIAEFVILFRDKYVVTSSSGLSRTALETLDTNLNLQGEAETFLPLEKPIRLGGTEFTHFEKMKGYPFTILAGYNHSAVSEKFRDSVAPKFINVLLLIVFFSLLLYVFRCYIMRYIIVPAQKLAEAARKISEGQKNVKIPQCITHEMQALSEQLSNVKLFMKNEQEAKESLELAERQLKNALQTIQESDKEREAFLRDMHRSLYMPIQAILNGTAIAKKHNNHTLIEADYNLILDAVYDAGKQLESLTTEFLNPTQVDIPEVINKCVILQKRYATERGIHLVSDISDNMPLIWSDRLRLRQIILSTIYHSLLYIPENEDNTITVTARINQPEDVPEWLEITIEDDGFGANEEFRLESWDNHFAHGVSFNRDPNMMNLGIEEIRHLVTLHHGTFEIEMKGKDGTKFLIRLPYLSKEQLEVHPTTRAQFEEKALENQQKIEEAARKAKNVIEFPNRKGKNKPNG